MDNLVVETLVLYVHMYRQNNLFVQCKVAD